MTTDPDRDVPQDLLRGYLAGLDHAALVGLLVQAAAEDESLDERLRAAALREALRTGAADPAALARIVETALEPLGRLDPEGSRHYAEQVNGAVALLHRALADGGGGGAGTVVGLAQRSVERFSLAAATAEDPSGALRGSADGLAALHLDACARARPDPSALADWLAQRHLAPGPERPPADLDAYADLLGAPGLEAYGTTMLAAWKARADSGRAGAEPVPRLARRLEQLHTLRGDTDALVEVLATDLGHPSRHLRIAELLAAAGRVPEAVAWAERGLAATVGQRPHDSALVAFLGAHYGALGRRDDAVALYRDQFLRRPDPAAYGALLDAAGPGGRAGQRAWALAELGRLADRTTARSWENPAGPLIEVLVADGDPDAAWSAALRHDAPHPARLRLALLRADSHPADAVPVYRQEFDLQVEAATRESYRSAAAWLIRLRELYARMGRPEEFRDLLAEIRDTHRARGSLLAELDAEGLRDADAA